MKRKIKLALAVILTFNNKKQVKKGTTKKRVYELTQVTHNWLILNNYECFVCVSASTIRVNYVIFKFDLNQSLIFLKLKYLII